MEDLAKGILAIIILAVLGIGILFKGGCNKQIFDLNYKFNQAMVCFPDGTVKTIKLSSWRDYKDGDQIQITDQDGKTYLFHANNIVLISNN